MEEGYAKPLFGDFTVSDRGKKVDNEDTKLSVRDNLVTVLSDKQEVVLTLPEVTSAKGRHFSILAKDGKVNAVTIKDNGESIAFTASVLSGNYSSVLIFSDGRQWLTIGSKSGQTA